LTLGKLVGRLFFMKRMLLSVFLLVGCVWSWAAEQVPDFKLNDVNPRSNRQAGSVSPRDYLLQVSGYYFGAAH
jgi:cell division septal protein FtsQ